MNKEEFIRDKNLVLEEVKRDSEFLLDFAKKVEQKIQNSTQDVVLNEKLKYIIDQFKSRTKRTAVKAINGLHIKEKDEK